MNLIQFFRELWFRIKLYYLGIRFYEVKERDSYPVVHETSCKFDDITVRVCFKCIPCCDLVLKRGQLATEDYSSYAVIASFDKSELNQAGSQTMISQLEFLDNKAFFFNGYYNQFGITENRKLELITDVYMDFISALITARMSR